MLGLYFSVGDTKHTVWCPFYMLKVPVSVSLQCIDMKSHSLCSQYQRPWIP